MGAVKKWTTMAKRRRRLMTNRNKVRRSPRVPLRLVSRQESTAIAHLEAPYLSVVIPAMNEQRRIGTIIRRCRAVHPNTEVIVVVNGSKDGTKSVAERLGARVIEFPFPIGHDVGRSIGAREAKGEVILFTDGDIVFQTRDLKKLVDAVHAGVDVALNKYEGPVQRKAVHRVVLAKFALNAVLHRNDLGGTSLTTIPHAISRKALQILGPDVLAVPPKAHAMAIYHQLNISPVHYFNVGKPNPRKRTKYRTDPLEKLIFGDHLEAMDSILQATDVRYLHSDLFRKRELVRESVSHLGYPF